MGWLEAEPQIRADRDRPSLNLPSGFGWVRVPGATPPCIEVPHAADGANRLTASGKPGRSGGTSTVGPDLATAAIMAGIAHRSIFRGKLENFLFGGQCQTEAGLLQFCDRVRNRFENARLLCFQQDSKGACAF